MSETGIAVAALREQAAEEIRALLARRKMSATELSRQMGVSQAYIWRRLSGETAFDLDDLEKIARLLGVRVFDLLPQEPQGGHVVYASERSRQTTPPYRDQAKRTSPVGWGRRRAPHGQSAVRPEQRRTGRVSPPNHPIAIHAS